VNPRQAVLLQRDTYRLLGEILEGEPGVVIDGGANVGEATKALRRHMPGRPIHAFEPVGEPFARLEGVCAGVGATPHRLALGDEAGDIEMNVNRNLWTSSILDANERGHAFHDDWCEVVRKERIGVVRLDEWARDHAVEDVALLKLDLQGYELRALRGAGGLLARTRAVYSEAQISQEYAGAATFSEIDGFLRSEGFGLYQVLDLCLKGTHLEPSCCDGLWLRRDVLERVRNGPTPGALRTAEESRGMMMIAALDACADRGFTRVALYGAGAHTVACGPALADPPVDVSFMIDDGRAGGRLWGMPVLSREEALREAIDAVVISSDSMEDQLYERCEPFLEKGLSVVRLYAEEGVRVTSPIVTSETVR
jgi:FkbM family methyltransferase